MDLHIHPLARTLEVRPGANLLEVLREHQVPVSYSCMSGRCGTCRCKVVSGQLLDGGQNAIRPDGQGERYVLACQSTLTESCTIEIPETDEVVVHPARVLKATVTGIDVLTHDIRRLRLKPNKPLEFSPGQYAQLQFGPELARPYSMAGLSRDAELEFHVRRVPGGRVTAHIFEQLRVGDTVRVSGPLGTAYLRTKHRGPMLCAAGGTGLAPILSIVRGAVAAGLTQPIHLYLGVRSDADVYGLPELRELQAQHPGLKVHVVVVAGPARDGQRLGLITDAIRADLPAGLDGWRAYLCGSPPMVEAASRLVQTHGLAPEQTHADAFYLQGT
ncbi:2Fe-2S iron-sulfur cluster-binding protein [Variovorax boronicumulans]|uniref:2Fe-2S iron-sulfur cluster-binding protein n=1 Tax=Variovorax boronicumulans TaxID=436515 RepID=UPI00085C722B|nr:2Fe-2S iron-sulfur cluster-binding protein [Variovorax boronicumulans]OEZ32599.1 naphthalene 1,2-dioxygenase [Variovorax boronicumulans]